MTWTLTAKRHVEKATHGQATAGVTRKQGKGRENCAEMDGRTDRHDGTREARRGESLGGGFLVVIDAWLLASAFTVNTKKHKKQTNKQKPMRANEEAIRVKSEHDEKPHQMLPRRSS